MLLACLQCKYESTLSAIVLRHTDNTSRHLAYELFTATHIACVWTTERHWQTERLNIAYSNVGTPFAWSLQQCEVGSYAVHDEQCLLLMASFCNTTVILDDTIVVWLLYNNPGRVGYGMTASLICRLAHEVPNIVGMKDTSGDMTLTEEFIRQNRDVDFKVFGGKDTLLYVSLCVGAVGGVCTAGNFMPELICDIYEKYVAGDMKGAMEAQFKLNPVRLSMDGASFPVAAKDMANLRGLDVGVPYLPNLPTAEGPVLERIRKAMREAGLID